jgi:hypothetical protein
MKQKPRIKLIKRHEGDVKEPRTVLGFGASPKGWSRAVRSWVTEFQKNRCDGPLPTFESLFDISLVEEREQR